MTIFKKCLQRLRHSARGARLVQCSIAVFCIAVALGMMLNAKKFPSSKSGKISCVKDRKIVLFLGCPEGAPDIISIPLIRAASSEKIPFLEFIANDEKWKTTALYSESVGGLMAELSLWHRRDPTPLIAFVQDGLGDEYFITIGKNGESSISSLQFLIEQSLISRRELEKQKYLGLKNPFASGGDGKVVFYIRQQSP